MRFHEIFNTSKPRYHTPLNQTFYIHMNSAVCPWGNRMNTLQTIDDLDWNSCANWIFVNIYGIWMIGQHCFSIMETIIEVNGDPSSRYVCMLCVLCVLCVCLCVSVCVTPF